MKLNNQPTSPNFQGYLRFKTAKNVVKTIDASKIATIVTGSAFIAQPFYLYKYDADEADFYKNDQTKTSPNGRCAAGVTLYSKSFPIEIKVHQLIYSDPRVGLPDKYSSNYHYKSKDFISNPYVEGSDYIVLDDKKMNDAFVSAMKSNEIVNIVDDCGQIPWNGIFDLNKNYSPMITDKFTYSGESVAEAYMKSASGLAVAEKEIGAENVIMSVNSLNSENLNYSECIDKIVDSYHDKEPQLTEVEKLEIVDNLPTQEL